MSETKGAAAGASASSPNPTGPTNSANHSINGVFPKPEEIWVCHTVGVAVGSPHACCLRCGTLFNLQEPTTGPEGKVAVLGLFLRGTPPNQAASMRQPKGRFRFLVHCTPSDSRKQIPNVLKAVAPDFDAGRARV
jgi:hypothetical protein